MLGIKASRLDRYIVGGINIGVLKIQFFLQINSIFFITVSYIA